MRKKQEERSKRQRDPLSSRYRGIGIQAVAAAVEPGQPEEGDERRSAGEERATRGRQKVKDK